MYHLMRTVLVLVQNTVQRYGGTLLQVSGEGFLALFGAPVAQEDHARRAMLAAFELRQWLHVPDALREAAAQRRALPGTAHGARGGRPGTRPTSALRCSWRYAPCSDPAPAAGWAATILASAATYRLVQDEVQGEARGPHARDTLYPGGRVCDLRSPAAAGGRPTTRRTAPECFVGRARELALLHARLAQAISGQGQAIGIAGEPGLGKSRLLAEFARSLDRRPATYCEGHCLAYGSAIHTCQCATSSASSGPSLTQPPRRPSLTPSTSVCRPG